MHGDSIECDMEALKKVLEIIEPLSPISPYLATCEVPQLNYTAFNHASENTLEGGLKIIALYWIAPPSLGMESGTTTHPEFCM